MLFSETQCSLVVFNHTDGSCFSFSNLNQLPMRSVSIKDVQWP